MGGPRRLVRRVAERDAGGGRTPARDTDASARRGCRRRCGHRARLPLSAPRDAVLGSACHCWLGLDLSRDRDLAVRPAVEDRYLVESGRRSRSSHRMAVHDHGAVLRHRRARDRTPHAARGSPARRPRAARLPPRVAPAGRLVRRLRRARAVPGGRRSRAGGGPQPRLMGGAWLVLGRNDREPVAARRVARAALLLGGGGRDRLWHVAAQRAALHAALRGQADLHARDGGGRLPLCFAWFCWLAWEWRGEHLAQPAAPPYAEL